MENVNTKLIVCDLDGTLLTDDKNITERTVQTMQRARDMGCKICLASGRGEQMMSIYNDTLHTVDYMVSDNGAIVRNMQDKEVLYKEPMSLASSEKILEYLYSVKLPFIMYTEDHIFYPAYKPDLEERVTKYEKKARDTGFPVLLDRTAMGGNWRELLQGMSDILKIVIYEKDEKIMQDFVSFMEVNLPDIRLESTGYGLMGSFSHKVSKKTAVLEIMKHENIPAKDVYVFGDYDNDLSMFSCAGNRIAMENAIEVVKEQATFITKSNNEDGVAVYIEEMLLNRDYV